MIATLTALTALQLVGIVFLGCLSLTSPALHTFGERVLTAVGCLFMMGVVLLLNSQLLSLPKPSWLELASFEEAEVVAYRMDEPSTLYLWLRLADEDGIYRQAPQAYAFPWDEETAKQLQRADGEGTTGGVRMRDKRLQERNLSEDPIFYPYELPPMPPKPE